MNKILIVDASASDYRVMSSLLSRAGYDPISMRCATLRKSDVCRKIVGHVFIKIKSNG